MVLDMIQFISDSGLLRLIFIIAIVYLFIENRAFRTQIATLQNDIQSLAKRISQSHQNHPEPNNQPNSDESSSVAIEASTASITPTSSEPLDKPEDSISTVTLSADNPWENKETQPWQPSPTSQTEESDWQKTISRLLATTNLTVKVGMVILFIGLAFLLKYASDNSLLSIEFRMIGVTLAGMTLLGLGWYLKDRNKLYALILQGGGVGVLYLTTFAAFKLYDLISIELGFILLILIMALSTALAIYQDTKALAFLGIGGGFLAPIITSTGAGNHIILFSYYAILNVSILAISWFKAWRELNLLGFIMTFVIGILWGVLQYSRSDFVSSEFFLILFFLFYVAISIFHALKQAPNLKGYVDGTLLFGTPLIASSIQAALMMPYEYGMAWSALALGLFYFAISYLLWLRHNPILNLMIEAFIAIGVIFTTIAIPLAFDGTWSAAAWAIEGAGVVWIAVRQRRKLAIWFGLIVQLGAGTLFALEFGNHSVVLPEYALFNIDFIGATMIALSGIFTAYLLYKQAENIPYSLSKLHGGFLIWGLTWWFFACWLEIDSFVARDFMMITALLHLAFTATILNLLQVKLSWQPYQYIHKAWLMMLSFLFIFSFITHSHSFTNMMGWLLNAGLFYLSIKWLESNRPKFILDKTLLHISGSLFFIFLLSIECHSLANEYSLKFLSTEGMALILPSIAALYLIIHKPVWPLITHRSLYSNTIAWPIVIVILLWNLTIGLPSEGTAFLFAYLPIFNPLDLTTIISIALIYKWWFSEDNHNLVELPPLQFNIITGLLVFALFNAIILRTLYHWFGIDYQLSAWLDSTTTQMVLSIAWSLLGFILMDRAHRLQNRLIWIISALLLTLVVIKLLIIDLSGTGSIERIISFIGVGFLLLIIGYLYPIPNEPVPVTERQRDSTKGHIE